MASSNSVNSLKSSFTIILLIRTSVHSVIL